MDVEVPHTNLTEVSRMVLVEVDPRQIMLHVLRGRWVRATMSPAKLPQEPHLIMLKLLILTYDFKPGSLEGGGGVKPPPPPFIF